MQTVIENLCPEVARLLAAWAASREPFGFTDEEVGVHLEFCLRTIFRDETPAQSYRALVSYLMGLPVRPCSFALFEARVRSIPDEVVERLGEMGYVPIDNLLAEKSQSNLFLSMETETDTLWEGGYE